MSSLYCDLPREKWPKNRDDTPQKQGRPRNAPAQYTALERLQALTASPVRPVGKPGVDVSSAERG